MFNSGEVELGNDDAEVECQILDYFANTTALGKWRRRSYVGIILHSPSSGIVFFNH
jgi:hypothetical protein